MFDSTRFAQEIEHASARHAHHCELSHVYQKLSQTRSNDPNFLEEPNDLNQQLVRNQILPNFQLVGIDDSLDLLTQNTAELSANGSDGSPVNGRKHPENSATSGLFASEQLMAKAFGVDLKANADGSYDVTSPIDLDPVKTAEKIEKSVMDSLLGSVTDGGSAPQTSPLQTFGAFFKQLELGWVDTPTPYEQPTSEEG